MKIKFVPRSKVKPAKKRTSKFKPLLDALGELKAGVDAIEVKYSNEKELLSMRSSVYAYQKSSGIKIKTGKDQAAGNAFFYRDK